MNECKGNLTIISVNVCGMCFREELQTEDSTNTAGRNSLSLNGWLVWPHQSTGLNVPNGYI